MRGFLSGVRWFGSTSVPTLVPSNSLIKGIVRPCTVVVSRTVDFPYVPYSLQLTPVGFCRYKSSWKGPAKGPNDQLPTSDNELPTPDHHVDIVNSAGGLSSDQPTLDHETWKNSTSALEDATGENQKTETATTDGSGVNKLHKRKVPSFISRRLHRSKTRDRRRLRESVLNILNEGERIEPSSEAGVQTSPKLDRVFALALYRRPAFPGFYQILQIADQEVLDFLSKIKEKGNGYIGGFMSKV